MADKGDDVERKKEEEEEEEEAALRRLSRLSLSGDTPLGRVASLLQPGEEVNGHGQKKTKPRVIVMVGAGISVSAGIPDFRTPGTGLYDNLQKYDLPQPEDIFCLEFFRERPEAFCTLARELFPGHFRPTPTHRFIKALADHGLLLRCFSQNIDGLELEAGLDPELLVQAHGGFQAAHCIDCAREHTTEFCRSKIMAGGVPRCEGCGAPVKPDIVFFGERLPDRFHRLAEQDFPRCDLLLVLGTSLQVQPFAGLIDAVPHGCPRALINREKVGERDFRIPPRLAAILGGGGGGGFCFAADGSGRDTFLEGDCDDTVAALVAALGWKLDEQR